MSLALDDELSELEGAMLHAHTSRCSACAAFEAEIGAITSRLRLAPLEPLPAPVALPPRRRTVARFAQVGAAAAVALVAAGIGTVLATSPGTTQLTVPLPKTASSQLSVDFLNAPQGLPQRPPISFRPRIGLDADSLDY